MALGPQLTNLDGVLADDELHVWHTDLAVSQEVIDRLFGLLDRDEQSKADRFLVPEARTQHIVSHALLRAAIAKYLAIAPEDVLYRKTAKGKPELAQNFGLYFNLSHTHGTAAIAITRAGRVGVDVEQIRDNLKPLELAKRFFSPRECDWLQSQPTSERLHAFFLCWTAKESYIKACGGGLSMGLDSFAIIPGTGNAPLQIDVYEQPEESMKWTIWQINLKPGLCAAVAAEAQNLVVRVGEWTRPA